MNLRLARSLHVAVVITAYFCPQTVAQQSPATTFSFLQLESSARAAALGGSFSAVLDDDVGVLFYNPALLTDDVHRDLSVSLLNHLAGVRAGFVAYGRHVEHVGTFGAGIRFVTWGEMDEFDETGNEMGRFGASDAALTLSYARTDDSRFHYGVSVHGVLGRVGSYGASAVAGDAGIAYHLPESRLTLSASANNFGIVLSSLGAADDRLPVDIRIGVAKRLEYVPLLLSATGYNLNRIGDDSPGNNTIDDVMRHIRFGGEFEFTEAFHVRFGYNHRKHQDLKMKTRLDMAGFGLGFGVRVTRVRFDYAYNSWSSLGGLHQITVRTVI